MSEVAATVLNKPVHHPEALAKIQQAQALVRVGEVYYFCDERDRRYHVTGFAIDQETEQVFVLHQALFGLGVLMCCPLHDFVEEVTTRNGAVSRRYVPELSR